MPDAPSELARETIRRLAAQRLPPTPDNYGRIYAELAGVSARAPAQWAGVIRGTLREWDRRQSGLTQARKRESLEQVLAAFGHDAEKLHARLGALTRAWSERREEAVPAEAPASGVPCAELAAKTLELGVVARLGHSPALQEEAKELAGRLRAARVAADAEAVGARVKQFFLRLELGGEDIEELLRALTGLLRLLADNLAELVADDRWMSGQVGAVQRLLAEPLERGRLAEAQRRFKDLVVQQGARKVSLEQAKLALKSMVSVFVDRLSALGESTGGFHQRVAAYAQRIAETDDLAGLGTLAAELLHDTRGMQADLLRAREEVSGARRRAAEHEERIRSLESELAQLSDLVREDTLTGTLNRRGLDEIWTVETARAARLEAPLCVAVLDIDNFKALNDRHGHQAGDQALVHLAEVIRRSLRPSDSLARFGGEEFVVLLPHTPLEEAVAAVTRLQRELTRRFFLHNNERLLITFSCGVTRWLDGESQEAALERADALLYAAKKAGKNRVFGELARA